VVLKENPPPLVENQQFKKERIITLAFSLGIFREIFSTGEQLSAGQICP